jgi:hypothetical protein
MKKNITFISHASHFWDSYRTIFDNFSEDQQYTVKVISNNVDFFNKKNIDAIPLNNNGNLFDLNRLSSDIIFRDSPYCEQMDTSIKGDTLSRLRGSPKICHIPYGMLLGVVEEKYFAHPFFNKCWKIFLDSEFKKKLVGKFYNEKVLNDKFIVSGYPKHDAYLVNHVSHSNISWGTINVKENIKKIIWAPHWSVSHYNYLKARDHNQEHGYSTFMKYKNYFLSILDKYKNLNIIMRPHPGLFNTLIELNHMTSNEVEDYKREFCSKNNGQIIPDGTYMDLFKMSDAMITDCSSFLGEYLPSGHPVLHLKRNLSPGFNEQGTNIINSYYSASDKEHIDEFIKDVVFSGKDPLAELRRSVLEKYLYINNKGAGKFIKEYIHESLKKESSSVTVIDNIDNDKIHVHDNINKIIKSLSVTSIIDVNCSHENAEVFKYITDISYHGINCNLNHITNIKNYFIDYDHMSFEAIDFTKNVLQKSDMILLLEPKYIGNIQELSSFLQNIESKSKYIVMRYSNIVNDINKLIPEPLYLHNINNIETLGIWCLSDMSFYLDDITTYLDKPHRKFIIKKFIILINELKKLLYKDNESFLYFIDSLTHDSWSTCYKLLSHPSIIERDRTLKLCIALYHISFQTEKVGIDNFDQNFKAFELEFLSSVLRNVAFKYQCNKDHAS